MCAIFSSIGFVLARKYSCGSIMWFFAQEIRPSATRGFRLLSSIASRFSACFTTAC